MNAESAFVNTTELVRRCLHGDAQAWDRLVARSAALVHSVPARHGLSPAEVDDVGQEVFLALAQSLHEIQDPERLPGWLATTARRYTWRASAKRRREAPAEPFDLGDPEAPGTAATALGAMPSPEELVMGWARQEALATALARLGERCRALLTLIFLDRAEPSYDEISARLGMPKGSIGPTRNRCLEQLRSILESTGLDTWQ